jgi:LysM repeat protein
MTSTIGLKLANGVFYAILEEDSDVKKRLILTTVHDNQQSMQIDLYKSFARSMADALYIGSIVVENIKKKPKGEPSVELIIISNANGEITADAADLDSSSGAESLHLSVSLKSIDEDNRELELPDFEIDSHEPPPQGLYEKASNIKEKQSHHRFPWVVLIIIGILIILLGLGLWFIVFRGQGIPADRETIVMTPPAQTQPVVELPPPVAEVEPAPVPAAQTPAEPAPPPRTEAPVIEAPPVRQPETSGSGQAAPQRSRRNPPVASYKVPATIPRDGHPYRIRWGDTLWDISEAFYRNPWLYPRIARFNNIRNPDRIISGRTIRIPPKN